MKKTHLLIAFIAITLSACGGNTVKPTVKEPPKKTSETTSKSTGDGGYYLDDGPEANPPKNLDDVPNAVPRDEPLHKFSNRPYKALGKSYYPLKSAKNYKARGVASWYGKRYHGKKTSSGEVYNMYAMTAAHTVLPLPSYVKVTNVENGRSVVVRVNDRGPFKHGREIDLSYVAAHQLRLIEKGSALVEVESIMPGQPQASPAKTNAPATPVTANQPTQTIAQGQYYIQAGVFKNEDNAINLVKELQWLNREQNTKILRVYNNGFHKVTLGPYNSRQDAEQFAQTIEQKLNTSTLINQK